MLAPALLVVILLFGGGLFIALTESLGLFGPVSEGLTLAHYGNLLTDREFLFSLTMTLLIATAATIISACLGIACALTMRRLIVRSSVLNWMMQAPLAIPHLAMAVALINVIAPSGLIARLLHLVGMVDAPADFPALINDRYGAGIILAYVLKETPFIAVMTMALLMRLGDEYDSMAKTLGATAWQRLRYVTLPLVAPAAVSASLVVFAYIFSAFEMPYLLGRPFPAMLSVVTQRRYLDENLAERPGAIACALVMTMMTALLVWVYLRFAERLTGAEKTLPF
jgi:putative spermidine/putrescine transport system permease protein